MSILELRVPKLSDTGVFDTKIIYKEKKYEADLSHHLNFTTHFPPDYFANATEVAIFYDDQPIKIPIDIAENLLKYLTQHFKAYNIDSKFICHPFATLLKTGQYLKRYQDNLSSATCSHLTPGDMVRFVRQEGELGSQAEITLIHSALFLGNGLFFSKNGQAFPMICTLDAMVETYPCDYIAVLTDIEIQGDIAFSNLSIHTSFKHKTYVPNGLAFRALNTRNESFRQFSPQAIARLYRLASLKFHPDKATLPQEQAAAFLSITQKIYDILKDPITRSEYNLSLLAGNDWSIVRILALYYETPETVKAAFDNYIALLKYYGNLTLDEERKIKNDPKYQRALEQADNPHNRDVVVHISSNVDHMCNQNPYHPTSVVFAGQRQNLEEDLYFNMPPSIRIGDLKISSGNPVTICFDKHKFNEQSTQSEEFLEKLPPGLISYSDVKSAISLLELWFSRDKTLKLNLNSQFGKKKQLTNRQPNSLVTFSNCFKSKVYHAAIYLGGNFYLYSIDPASPDIYIANIASLQLAHSFTSIWPLIGNNNCSAQESVQQLAKSQNVDYMEAESFPLLPHDQSDQLKRYLLTFSSAKENDFIAALHGLKLKQGSIQYIRLPNFRQTIIRAGDSILLCKGNKIVLNAMHLGNYLFALASPTGYLRVVNLLMLSESVNWDKFFIMEPITPLPEGGYSCEIIPYREKILFEQIEQPLLYEILDIPFDLTHLSHIDEQTVVECYNKRLRSEKDQDVIYVLNRAYKLLMSDFYRVLYGTEILFGGEPELSVSILLEVKDITPPADIIKKYTACLKLINNPALKERISYEQPFIKAQRILTINTQNQQSLRNSTVRLFSPLKEVQPEEKIEKSTLSNL